MKTKNHHFIDKKSNESQILLEQEDENRKFQTLSGKLKM